MLSAAVALAALMVFIGFEDRSTIGLGMASNIFLCSSVKPPKPPPLPEALPVRFDGNNLRRRSPLLLVVLSIDKFCDADEDEEEEELDVIDETESLSSCASAAKVAAKASTDDEDEVDDDDELMEVLEEDVERSDAGWVIRLNSPLELVLSFEREEDVEGLAALDRAAVTDDEDAAVAVRSCLRLHLAAIAFTSS